VVGPVLVGGADQFHHADQLLALTAVEDLDLDVVRYTVGIDRTGAGGAQAWTATPPVAPLVNASARFGSNSATSASMCGPALTWTSARNRDRGSTAFKASQMATAQRE
jgi:hypothetical protein